MITIDGNLLNVFSNLVTANLAAFLPLIAAVMGIFIAFGIINSLSYFIKKAGKR